MTQKTLSEIASDVNKQFTVKHREPNDNGYWILKDSAPEEYRELCRAAHGDRFPDDDIYRFIVSALDSIAEANTDDEDDIRDRFLEMEPDIYTGQLTAWLARNINNVHYIDDVIDEEPKPMTGSQLLAAAQLRHRLEVAAAVLSELQKLQDQQD